MTNETEEEEGREDSLATNMLERDEYHVHKIQEIIHIYYENNNLM